MSLQQTSKLIQQGVLDRHAHIRACNHTGARTRTHMHTRMHRRTHTRTPACIDAHTHTHTHMHSHAIAQTHAHAHMHTHTQPHAQKHACTRTHTCRLDRLVLRGQDDRDGDWAQAVHRPQSATAWPVGLQHPAHSQQGVRLLVSAACTHVCMLVFVQHVSVWRWVHPQQEVGFLVSAACPCSCLFQHEHICVRAGMPACIRNKSHLGLIVACKYEFTQLPL